MDFGKKLRQAGVFVYDLPRLRGWHAHGKLIPSKNKGTFSWFGYNWWDLMASGYFQKSKYVGTGKLKLHIYRGPTPGYVIVNCGETEVILKNEKTGDTYVVGKYGKTYYNKVDKTPFIKYNTLITSSDVMLQYVKVGDAHLILCNIQQLLSGQSNITKTPIFTDLMLSTGVVNPNQYYSTTGLNAFLDKAGREGSGKNSKIETEESLMQEWVGNLSEHWGEVNPSKRLPDGNSIPFKIHWIWLGKKPGSPSPLKPKYAKFMRTWIERNPNCEYNLWTDSSDPRINKDLEEFITVRDANDIIDLLNKLPKESQNGIKKILKKHPNVGSRADSLRQAILYIEGGCYADVNDMACLMPMEPYFDKFDFMAGLEPMLYVNNAFVASAKGHIIVKNFLLFIAKRADEFIEAWDPDMDTTDKDDLVVSQTGPIAFSSIINGVLGNIDLPRTCIFPSKFIYSNYEISESPLSWLSPITLSAHYDERAYLKM